MRPFGTPGHRALNRNCTGHTGTLVSLLYDRLYLQANLFLYRWHSKCRKISQILGLKRVKNIECLTFCQRWLLFFTFVSPYLSGYCLPSSEMISSDSSSCCSRPSIMARMYWRNACSLQSLGADSSALGCYSRPALVRTFAATRTETLRW